MNELSSFFDKMKSFRIGSSNEHSPSSTGFLITVFIKGSGIQHILSSLEKSEHSCFINTNLFINDDSIPYGSQIASIQGYDVSNKSLSFIADLLYMLRNREIITIQFSPDSTTIQEESPITKRDISLPQCVLFLLSHYSTIALASKEQLDHCRPNVMRNHYITLQQLNHKNNNLNLEDILSPSDMEHVLVVERLFLHAIKSLFPQPIIYKQYTQSLYEGSQFKPSIEQIRMILKHVHSPCLPSLYTAFRLYDSIYQQYSKFLTKEIIPILCEDQNPILFSTLILSSSQLLQDQRELWLAGCMLEWLSTKIHLQFSSTLPPDAQQYRSASLLMVLQESSTKLAINMQLSTNNAVSLYDILDACLLLLTGEKDGLFGEWFLSIMKMIPVEHDAKQSQFTILNQIHSLILLLPFCQRRCLFWLVLVISSSSELVKKVAQQLLPNKAEMLEFFLKTVVNHIEFAFMPSTPNSTTQLASNDMVMTLLPSSVSEIVYPSFSMHSSFGSLHESAKVCSEHESDLSLLKKYYSISESCAYPRVVYSNTVEWNNAYATIVRKQMN